MGGSLTYIGAIFNANYDFSKDYNISYLKNFCWIISLEIWILWTKTLQIYKIDRISIRDICEVCFSKNTNLELVTNFLKQAVQVRWTTHATLEAEFLSKTAVLFFNSSKFLQN